MVTGVGHNEEPLPFEVDKDFVPSKLIIECATCGAGTAFRPVRITPASN